MWNETGIINHFKTSWRIPRRKRPFSCQQRRLFSLIKWPYCFSSFFSTLKVNSVVRENSVRARCWGTVLISTLFFLFLEFSFWNVVGEFHKIALPPQAGNHDKSRLVTRYGEHRAQAVTMITLLLPGVGVTYNGEEIGMEDTWISWEDTKDPQGCNAGKDRYEKASRDPARTPFQWDNTISAGTSCW